MQLQPEVNVCCNIRSQNLEGPGLVFFFGGFAFKDDVVEPKRVIDASIKIGLFISVLDKQVESISEADSSRWYGTI